MKTLDLTNLEKSDIKYEISRFPDGQQQVRITGNDDIKSWFLYYQLDTHDVQIKSRLNNFKDLELIICAVASLRELGVKEIHLYTPYFLGSRNDRKFEEGSNNYLKDVICPIINSLRFESITVLDPHSDVLEACLNNFKKVNNQELVEYSLQTIYEERDMLATGGKDFILISPDAGANKKVFKVAEQIGYTGDISTCSKSRDNNGKLTRVVVPLSFNHIKKDFIIIDDICDGGATFLGIAEEIKRQFPSAKIYLIITHGIFSKGFDELSKYFDGIYCTNSYSDLKSGEDIQQISQKICKQLNVF